MFQILVVNLAVLFLFMSSGYIEAKSKKRLDTVDVCWGLGFILIAWLTALQSPTNRSALVATIVTIWGVRLSWHIYSRTKFRGDDERYKEITSKWKGDVWRQAYPRLFLLQGGLIWIISLPVMLLANPTLNGAEYLISLGGIFWLVGFTFEATADWQLQNFLKQKNRPRVMKTGLWRYSRHPNYFGELLQWWGIAVMALAVSYGWIGLVGPILLTYLIVFVSGLPPIERKRAGDKDFQAYKQSTSALIPLPPRR